MKKIIAALLGAVLLTGSTAGLAACGGGTEEGADAKYKYDITVWVGEGTQKVTEDLITQFNRGNGQGIWFNARVIEKSEQNAAGDAIAKPEDAADIFCFATDQIARLVYNDLLSQPTGANLTAITTNHTTTAVDSVTVGDTVYAYPLTEDNGYFLYYDKRCFPNPADVDSIESIVDYCTNNNRYFAFGLDGGWYFSSFFYAFGAKSEWTVESDGRFTSYTDTFNSDNGLLAAKGMQKVIKCGRYIKNGKADEFSSSIPAAAVVSGVWDYQTAKDALKENLGVAKLPTVTVDGRTERLVAPLGCKMLGVTRQNDQDGTKTSALHLLAKHLTNNESQMERFKNFNWRPSTKEGQDNEDVKNNEVLKALLATATVHQGQYPEEWSTKAETLSTRIEAAESDTALLNALSQYQSAIAGLIE